MKKNEIHNFQCMGKTFSVEFHKIPLKFCTKYLTHTMKDMERSFCVCTQPMGDDVTSPIGWAYTQNDPCVWFSYKGESFLSSSIDELQCFWNAPHFWHIMACFGGTPVLSKFQNPGSPDRLPMVDAWVVHITLGVRIRCGQKLRWNPYIIPGPSPGHISQDLVKSRRHEISI